MNKKTVIIIIGVIILLGVAYSLGNSSDKVSARIFMGMIVLVYLGVICDNLSWALEGTEHTAANYILNMCAYIIMPFVLVLFWSYQSRVFLDDFERSKKIKLIINVAAVVDILNVIAGTVTGYLFYISEDGMYCEGNGYFTIFIYPIITVICCVYENVRRKLPLQKKISLLAFGVTPVIALGFVMFVPDYSTIYVAFFVDLILVYGTVQVQKEQELAKKNGVELVLGTDCVATDGLDFATMTVKEGAKIEVYPSNAIPAGMEGLDAGPAAQANFAAALKDAKTILWNGPAGVFECDDFTAGSKAIGDAIAEATANGAFSLIGGGDSVACCTKFGLTDKVSYISTGGGALLEAIEGKVLPGVAAIKG